MLDSMFLEEVFSKKQIDKKAAISQLLKTTGEQKMRAKEYDKVLLVMNSYVKSVLEEWALDFEEDAVIYADEMLSDKADYFHSLTTISRTSGTYVKLDALETIFVEAMTKSKINFGIPFLRPHQSLELNKEASSLLRWLKSHGVTAREM